MDYTHNDEQQNEETDEKAGYLKVIEQSKLPRGHRAACYGICKLPKSACGTYGR
jgi:hypothetical protein